MLLASFVSLGILWLFAMYTYLPLPNVNELKRQNPTSTAFMKQYDGATPLKQAWVPYSKIAPGLKQAVVISEDASFFSHSGFDWNGIREAFEKNWKKKELTRGGSTITQQLAKNLYLSPSKNPFRKIKEILITLQLEQNLSKQRILEIYLNVVEWGEGIYGAEAAALYYFHLNASELSPAQSAWLAAILPNPRYYQKHRGNESIQRKVAMILGRMGY